MGDDEGVDVVASRVGVLVASFYSPCKSGIYVDSARGIYVDSSFLSFSANFFQGLIEIVMLQEWLTTHWKAYSK